LKFKSRGIAQKKAYNDVKMDFQEVEYGGMGWMELAQDRDR